MTLCNHKTMKDHCELVDASGDIPAKIRIWTCSYCGEKSEWTEQHEYYGNIECKFCQTAEIEEVRCGNCKRPDKINVSEAPDGNDD